MLVDMKVFSFSTCLTRFSTYKLVDDNTVDGKDNKEKATRGASDIMMYHFSKNHWSSAPPCWRPSPPSVPYYIMNFVFVTHIEAVKHLNVPIIKTAHHTPAFIEEHSC